MRSPKDIEKRETQTKHSRAYIGGNSKHKVSRILAGLAHALDLPINTSLEDIIEHAIKYLERHKCGLIS